MSSSGGFLSAKALSTRMKARGLQRLRWFCQMCSKQCRDENGFKCHTQSESHLRQMQLFASDAASFIERFSQQLVDGYLSVLSRMGGRRVKANQVYTQYIADRQHAHMNSTKWDSLSSFVSYLGHERLAAVDQDAETGEWFVQHIDRDPRALQRQAELQRKAEKQRSAEDEERRRIQQQVEEASSRQMAAGQARQQQPDAADWPKDEEGRRRPLSLSLSRPAVHTAQQSRDSLAAAREEGSSGEGRPTRANALSSAAAAATAAAAAGSEAVAATEQGQSVRGEKRKVSAVEAIMLEEEERKRRLRPQAAAAAVSASAASPPSRPAAPAAEPPWLFPSLTVKVVRGSSSLRGQKARVLSVHDGGYSASLLPLAAAATAASPPPRLHQSELETVIPAIGHTVLIVRGSARGRRGRLLRLSADQSRCDVLLDEDGQTLSQLQLEDVCKIDSQQSVYCSQSFLLRRRL